MRGVGKVSLDVYNFILKLNGKYDLTGKAGAAVTEQIEKLKLDYQFDHVYVNTHDADEELVDELQVTKLPAFFLVKGDREIAQQSASPEAVAQAVDEMCAPNFTTDADF